MAKVVGPINEASLKALENGVCKGIPYRFVMIYKASEVVGLRLFKKPAYDRNASKLLSAGLRGTPICGIVTGSGKKLHFQVAGNEAVAKLMGVTDFYSKAPVGSTKVKSFFTTYAELSASATFDLVIDSEKLLTVVDDGKEDDGDDELPQGSSSQSQGSQNESSSSEERRSDSKEEVGPQESQPQDQEQPPWETLYLELRKTLIEDVKRVGQTNAKLVEQLKPAFESAKELHANGEFQQAFERLNKIASILAAEAALARNKSAGKEHIRKRAMARAISTLEEFALRKSLSGLEDAWSRTRAKLIEQLKEAEQQLLAVCIGQPNIGEVVAKSPRLYEISNTIDHRLTARLSEALAAVATPEALPVLLKRSLDVVGEYRTFVSTDPKLAALSGAKGELQIIDIGELMTKTLNLVKSKLESVKDEVDDLLSR